MGQLKKDSLQQKRTIWDPYQSMRSIISKQEAGKLYSSSRLAERKEINCPPHPLCKLRLWKHTNKQTTIMTTKKKRQQNKREALNFFQRSFSLHFRGFWELIKHLLGSDKGIMEWQGGDEGILQLPEPLEPILLCLYEVTQLWGRNISLPQTFSELFNHLELLFLILLAH